MRSEHRVVVRAVATLAGNANLGHEIDVVDPRWSPSNVEVLARGANFNASQLDISSCSFRRSTPVTAGGEMIYFDHPGGGGVFGAPSVACGGSGVVDAVASGVLRNVLDRFLGARCVTYNGSGVNPTGFACTSDPVLGSTWSSAVPTSARTTATAVGLAAQPAQLAMFGGEVLLSLAPPPLFVPGFGSHSIAVPNDPALIGAPLFAQAMRVDVAAGAGQLLLFNGQRLTLGR